MPGPVDPRLPETIKVRPGPADGDGDEHPAQTRAVREALRQRIESRINEEPDGAARRWPALAGGAVTLVVTDGQGRSELSWSFQNGHNGHRTADEGGSLLTMIASPQIWQALLDGEANMIVEIRGGRLRCVNTRDAHRVRSDEVHAVAWLLGLAQVPLACLAIS